MVRLDTKQVEKHYRNGEGFTLKIVEHCLFISGKGSWNADMATDYVGNLQALVVNARLSDWCAIVDIRDWNVSTPDAKPIFQQNTRWCAEHGMKKVFILYGNNDLAAWTLKTQGAYKDPPFQLVYIKQKAVFLASLISNRVLESSTELELLL